VLAQAPGDGQMQQALDMVGAFAERLCGTVSLQGSKTSTELSANAKADLNGVINRLVDLGIGGAADYKTEQYQGLLQADFVNALKDNATCRTSVLALLKDKLISTPCAMDGRILDRNSNQPIAGVNVQYFRFTADANPYAHEVKSSLATSGPDGRFHFDCQSIEPENYPLRIVLSRAQWGPTSVETNEYLRAHDRKVDVNVFVNDQLMQNLEAKRSLSASKKMGPLEAGYNISGDNLADYQTADPQTCSDYCRLNSRCISMTYSQQQRHCWLHSSQGTRAQSNDLTSAMKVPP
jgi:hypothetical protein